MMTPVAGINNDIDIPINVGADRLLKIYEHLKGTAKYYGILSVIRNKIVGHADIALESYNTPLNWEKISKCLTLHYAEKRDLGTLEDKTLVQGTNTVLPEFYLSSTKMSIIIIFY